MRLTISEFARLVGLAPSALRFYDDCGLLPPAEVDATNGYRYYDRSQAERARLLRDLREIDLPLPDVRLALDAAPADVERWYVARFQELVLDAADDPDSFYAGWVGLPPADVADLARAVWATVNLHNLTEHIDPTRARADVILHKGPDHRILSVEWMDP